MLIFTYLPTNFNTIRTSIRRKKQTFCFDSSALLQRSVWICWVFFPFTCIIFCVSTNFFATTSIIVNIYVYILPNEPVCVYHFMRNKVQKKLIRNNQSVNIYFVTTRFIASGLLKIHISRCIGR